MEINFTLKKYIAHNLQTNMRFLYKTEADYYPNTIPTSIVSLVPSITELLCDLGLLNKMMGRTKFCIHPKQHLAAIPIVGGTKNIRFNTITQLKPSIIIANKEENRKEDIEILMQAQPVLLTDIKNLQDVYELIQYLGNLFQVEQTATTLLNKLHSDFQQPFLLSKSKSPIFVTYLIWQKPFITVGGDTFINEIIKYAGLKNEYESSVRYPEISFEELNTNQSNIILLSSEPFPFKAKHLKELQTLLPNKRFILVDGELFSWYGSRLLHTANYLKVWLSENQLLESEH